MNIVLIGYRGTGKTAVGWRLAKALGREFVDTDDVIVRETGKSIPRIFAESGEAGFRKVEGSVIERVSKKDNCVISAGGGAVVREASVRALKANGIVFLLEAGPKTIFGRIGKDGNRPALTERNKLEEIEHVLRERKPLYERAADYRVDGEKFSVEENVSQIIEMLKKRGELK